MLRWQHMDLATPFPDAIDAFLIACDASNKSERTKRWYRANLLEFTKWLTEKGITATLADLEPGLVNAYLVHRRTRSTRTGRRASVSALRADAMTLKVFANWLAKEELLCDRNGASVLRRVSLPRHSDEAVRRNLKDAELERIIDSTTHPRDRALIVLLAGCGLRLNEARELRLGDLDWNERTLRVRGATSKSRRDRLVDVPADVAGVLHRYVREHRVGDRRDDAPLFTTRSGKGFTLDGFGKLFTKIKQRSGIADFSAHLLRHTWATNFRRAGSGDLFDLQEQGGWKRLEMVRRYAKQRPREERLHAPSPLGVLGSKSLTKGLKVG